MVEDKFQPLTIKSSHKQNIVLVILYKFITQQVPNQVHIV